MSADNEWIAVEFMRIRELRKLGSDTWVIRRMVSPFYEGERWAARCGGLCLSVDWQLECEPIPSSRDDEFYRQFRFLTFEDAAAAVEKYLHDNRGQFR